MNIVIVRGHRCFIGIVISFSNMPTYLYLPILEEDFGHMQSIHWKSADK